MSRFHAFDEKAYDYLVANSSRESAVLARLREETQRLPNAQMQIGPDQGQFFYLLMKLIGARKTLELGVFTGYSSLWTALALPDDGKLIACDVSEEYTSVARRYWKEAGVAHKIDLRLAPATETLDKLIAAGESGSFDFAFIDAVKTEYADYYERCLTLLRKGGLIAVDNVLQSGRVIDAKDHDANTEAIRAFNHRLHHDERVELSMIAVADGLTLCIKR
jgi:predicted O-methyltransferase YrrM